MDSEALRTELPRLLAAATGLSAGVLAAIAVRSLMHRGDGGGARRSVAIMVAASAALAFGAGFFVYSARLGQLAQLTIDQHTLAYTATGFAAGVLTGFFPFHAGVPLFVLAAAVSLGVVSTLAPTVNWVDGAQAARFTVYSATDSATVCGVSIQQPGALARERDFTLPPGQITLEISIFDIRGPFSAAFGERRYRLDTLAAGDSRTALGTDVRRQPISPATAWLLRLTGCRYRAVVSTGFVPEDMLSATLVLEADGEIRLDVR